MRPSIIPLCLALASGASAAQPLDLPAAVERALLHSPVLRAGGFSVEAARADAAAAHAGHLPTLELGGRVVRTDEPAGAFGLRLDEGRLAASDFDPARLNAPSAVGGLGLSASLNLPLYSGGRTRQGELAAQGLAQAEEESQARRRQEVAFAVVQAYFGARAAALTSSHEEEAVASARELERLIGERVAQGLLLDADALRATAFRAQAEARLAGSRHQLATSRAALEMLLGAEVDPASLSTPLETSAASLPAAPDRPDLRAASLHTGAAQAQARAAGGALLPEVFLQASAQTLRSSVDQGTSWTALLLGFRWELSLGAVHATTAARARAAAVAAAEEQQGAQARRELEEARSGIAAAAARGSAAREALAASQSARTLRLARYRQGLLPLTDLLDAELALSSAWALLVSAQLENRMASASLQLALGQPIEGARQ